MFVADSSVTNLRVVRPFSCKVYSVNATWCCTAFSVVNNRDEARARRCNPINTKALVNNEMLRACTRLSGELSCTVRRFDTGEFLTFSFPAESFSTFHQIMSQPLRVDSRNARPLLLTKKSMA